MSDQTVTIVGNGAGGCAAAASLADRGAAVVLVGRSASKVDALAAAGALVLVEGGEARSVVGITHTTDLSSAAGSEMVLLMVPTSAIVGYAEALAPHLAPDATVVLAPGHTGGALAFRAAVRRIRPELASIVIAETFTLPFVTRMTGPAEVTVWRRMSHLLTGVLPARATTTVVDEVRRVFPDVVAAGSVLESSLSNLNAIMHPPGMLANVGWIEHTAGDFRFYREGVTPGVARIMDGLDRERLAVAEAFGLRLPPFVELFQSAGLVSAEVAAAQDTYLAVHESGPNLEIRSPASLTDRYVEEDVGSGLVALSALAACAGVDVPVTEALVTMANLVNAKDYRQVGLTADLLGIAGLGRDGLLAAVTG
ncbi:NAD/NADP octopine/nopaline dehydrogenase family protein [Pseudonocardia xishanensis]|uniref:Opine dehydrogenase n=1 Tax=Pseudonocardia xishanensis TaxID=630995 RepID=A0ABP8RDV0_9PSEU